MTQSITFNARLHNALPPIGKTFLLSLFWAAACAVSCVITLIYFRGWNWSQQTLEVIAFYGAGAGLALYPAAYISRLLSKSSSTWRLILFAVLLALATLFFTACLFAFQFRIYFSQWHGEPFSRLWLWQQMFTAAGAVYTYLVIGLRFYVPVAVIALFATSWWLNRLPD